MRIVGGTYRGRTLSEPKSSATRPTSDRVREALFNILMHDADLPNLEGARVIDLFAGTGALGLEALSRGAAFSLFIENSADARGVIRRNIEDFGAQGISKLWRRDATKLGPVGTLAPFDFAFLDPPYDKELGPAALTSLQDGGWLRPGAAIVLEERATNQIALPAAFSLHSQRTYGDTQVVIAMYQAEDQPTDVSPNTA